MEQINAAGSVLGEPVSVVGCDARFELTKCTRFTSMANLRDDVDVPSAGHASSPRAAIWPMVQANNLHDSYPSLWNAVLATSRPS